ncbi:MAG: hypothetical protein APF81_08615 [Desulfosporosinus sp. BRH_c37]|nr:MAG: hypothetical protein APF81_08615 [Desulfosporosinus sp. BRH_c37]
MHFLIVDFEFTMHKRYGRPRVWFPEIIEVGAVVADGYGVLQDTVYNAFVKPQFWPRISEDCTGITGIHQRDIEHGISFEQMLQSLWQMSPTQDKSLRLMQHLLLRGQEIIKYFRSNRIIIM